MTPTLTLRQLNRTYLARQLLLERHALSITDAIERLLGLQAQVNNPPYMGLWTRLHTFERDDLTQLMQARQVGRTALMRSTLHLFTAADYAHYWATIQPALLKGLNSFFGRSIKGLDVAPLVAAAQTMFEAQPRTFADVKTALAALAPDRDLEALAYIARTYVPHARVFERRARAGDDSGGRVCARGVACRTGQACGSAGDRAVRTAHC